MKNYFFAVVAFLAFCGTVSAQNVVTGKVTDKTGNPVAGAKVANTQGTEQVTTGPDGKFTIESAQPISKLKFEYMGMKTTKQKAENGMNVMMSDAHSLSAAPDHYKWFGAVQMAFADTDPFKPSFGLMLGMVKEAGWYVKGVYRKQQSTDHEYYYDEYMSNSLYSTTGDKKPSYMSFTAGGVLRLLSPLHVYGGAGYYKHKVAEELTNGEYVEYKTDSGDGVALDLGLFYDFKYFMINAGITVNVGNGTAGNVGIGYVF